MLHPQQICFFTCATNLSHSLKASPSIHYCRLGLWQCYPPMTIPLDERLPKLQSSPHLLASLEVLVQCDCVPLKQKAIGSLPSHDNTLDSLCWSQNWPSLNLWYARNCRPLVLLLCLAHGNCVITYTSLIPLGCFWIPTDHS